MAEPQGTETPQVSQGQGAPEATNEAAKSLTNEDVNRAITARFRDYEKKLESKLTEAFGGFNSKFDELGKALAGIGPKPAGEAAETGDDASKQPGVSPPQTSKDPEVIALKRQLTELKNSLKAEQEQAKVERARAREVSMRKALAEKLGALGVDAARAKHAVGYLVDVTKTVSIDETERMSFRDSDGEPIDIDSGLRSWIASEDGKLYVPPRGIAGSGDAKTSNGAAVRSNAPADPLATARKLMAERYRLG